MIVYRGRRSVGASHCANGSRRRRSKANISTSTSARSTKITDFAINTRCLLDAWDGVDISLNVRLSLMTIIGSKRSLCRWLAAFSLKTDVLMVANSFST